MNIPDITIRQEPSLDKIASWLSKFNVERKMIPVDIIVWTNPQMVIERKTCSDFLGSIVSGRLHQQIDAMNEIGEQFEKYIVLEGSWAQAFKFSHMNEASVVGQIDAIRKRGVQVLPFRDKTWTCQFLHKVLSEAHGEKPKYSFKLRASASKDFTMDEKVLYVLEGIVGEETAKAVLKQLKSIRAIAITDKDTLTNITVSDRRIGKHGEKIYNIMNHSYGEK